MVGRRPERARLTGLLDAAREGRSGTLLFHGPPGIGKTELLRFAIASADGFRVLRARGMETESDIPFAGLAELVMPLVGRLDELPSVQADALRGALALGPPTAADRFTVPAALLSLLSLDEQPVLAVIDDAQWLDEPSLDAFLFAGRRLHQEGVAMVAAARDDVRRIAVPWLDRVAVAPLDDAEARELLDAAIAPGVASRLMATAAGNPLALLEIPGLLSPAQLAGREPLEDPLRPGTGVESAFAAAVDALPGATQRALLLAAAAGTRRLDALPVADLEPAESARIVSLADGELEFRHPLMRSTVYHRASSADRRAAHAFLASVSVGAERAWHLAACAVAPDESVASALEQAALDARSRGAYATSARDLHRAAQLTPDDGERARRLLAAAGDAIRCGEAERASGLLDEVSALSDDPLLAADVARLKGHVEMRRGSPVAANEQLVREAERVRGRDPRRAASMFLEASVAHLMTGDFFELVPSAERARALSTGVDPAVELLATALVGEAQIALGEVSQGVAELRACEPYLMEADPLAMVEIVGMAAFAWVWVADFERASRLLARVLSAARNASAVTALIHPLAVQAHLDLRRGRWAAALAGATEAAELADDAGQLALLPHALAALALVEAGLGHETDCRAHVARGLELSDDVFFHAALGHLELGLGRIPEAIDALETGERQLVRRGLSSAVVQLRSDLIEAYVRAGRREEAEALCARLTGAGIERCRGLLADEAEYRDVFAGAGSIELPFERARTQLAFGERLRRSKQRAEAREPLTAALDEFERLGARPWAERARAELRATGGPSGPRREQAAADQLTPHELQIAVLVAQGMTNREAAAALFLSPKTIEYHLGQIYRKLDVRGRAQLARYMALS